jgi:hypothetical protein
MFLKELVSYLSGTLCGQLLREKRPFEKLTPKVGANIGAITGILLRNQTTAHREDLMDGTVNNLIKF